MNDELIANKIKIWRLKRKISQVELAEKLGISQPFVSQIQSFKTYSAIEKYVDLIIEKFPDVTEEDLITRKQFISEHEFSLHKLEMEMLRNSLEDYKSQAFSNLILAEKLKFKLKYLEDTISKTIITTNQNEPFDSSKNEAIYKDVLEKLHSIICTPIS